MNKNDRKEVSKWVDELNEIKTDIETLQEEQEERFDNLPEGIQDSERGEKMLDAIHNLQSAADSIEDVMDYLNELLT